MLISEKERTSPFSVGSGVPSVFAGNGMKNVATVNKIGAPKANNKGQSYRNINVSNNIVAHESDSEGFRKVFKGRNSGLPKVDILAIVDHAIEDGPTRQAKEKAANKKALSRAPIPRGSLRKPSSFSTKPSSSVRKSLIRSLSEDLKSKSFECKADNSAYELEAENKKSDNESVISSMKKQEMELKNAVLRKRMDERAEKNNTIRRSASRAPIQGQEIRSKAPGSVYKNKAEILKPAVKKREIEPSTSITLVTERPSSSRKRGSQRNCTTESERSTIKQTDVPKKEKTKMKGGKQKHITDGNLRQKEREENHNKMIANEKPSKRVMQLRKQLEETQQKLKRVTVVSNQELKELDQDLKKAKEAIRFRIMKVIYTQKNKNFEVFEKYQEEVDENQRWIDEYRSANEILRDTLKELPKEIADLKIANQTMEKANRDVAGHLEVLKKASEKLQSEKDRLLATSEKLKNEHIPRYRQQILRGELHFEAESKAKNIYRDCLIETMKKIEQSRQKDLIEDVFALFSEKEGDVNTEFVAKFLTDHSDDSSTDSYSDSDKCNDYE